jgi:type I restriction-modification system DNA methylase subunit
MTNRQQLHERLWAAAEQLRANSGLKLNEMSEPILGLIFLKFADVRLKKSKVKSSLNMLLKHILGEINQLLLTITNPRVFYIYPKLQRILI